ncbi:hypothetical protein ES703_38163 [subsurface metagenome]
MSQEIKFNNYAKLVRKRGDNEWFDWKIFVDAPKDELKKIKYVEYELHKSFPDPVRRKKSPRNCFALETSGWGEFSIPIKVIFKDGTTKEFKYDLDLRKKWPKKE